MLLKNGNVFDGEQFLEGMEVRLAGDIVAETGYDLQASDDEKIIDLAGDYLLPGFVDVHIHAFKGRDTMNGEEAVRSMSRELFRLGVAGFCPTTMSADEEDTMKAVAGIRAVMVQPEPEGAAVLGAHMEAPFLQEERAGAQRKEFFRDPDWDSFVRMTGGHEDTVRLITMAPERKGSEAFIRKAVSKGIRVSAGHTSADAETFHRAVKWGINHVTHTFNAQTPLKHREPGIPGGALTEDGVYCEMICDGIHLHHDIVRLIARCKGAEKAVAITDAMEAAGMPEGNYSLGGQRVIVKDGAARLADGTLAGSVLTMPNALENLIHRFGIDPTEACAMCTSAPADSIGETRFGRITAGSPVPLTRWGRDWKMKGIVR